MALVLNRTTLMSIAAMEQLEHFKHSGSMTPGEASKFRGLNAFNTTWMFERIGRAGSAALKQRQYHDAPPWTLNDQLEEALAFQSFLVDMELKRIVSLAPPELSPLLIASDAQCDSSPSGGIILYDDETKFSAAAFIEFDAETLAEWGCSMQDPPTAIQACEAVMIPLALVYLCMHIRNRRVLWFVDNSSALYGFIKGGSKNQAVDRCVFLYNALCYRFQCKVWFEFINSSTNWADGVSRLGFEDPFAQACSKKITLPSLPLQVWSNSLPSVCSAIINFDAESLG